MDARFTELMERLDERRLTHPNVCMVWKCYLQKKRERLDKEMLQCEEMLTHIIPHLDDVPLTTLFMMGQIPMVVNGDTET